MTLSSLGRQQDQGGVQGGVQHDRPGRQGPGVQGGVQHDRPEQGQLPRRRQELDLPLLAPLAMPPLPDLLQDHPGSAQAGQDNPGRAQADRDDPPTLFYVSTNRLTSSYTRMTTVSVLVQVDDHDAEEERPRRTKRLRL